MINKILKYILPIFLIFVLLCSYIPITAIAQGEDEAKLIVYGNVDPRVKAKGQSVALIFFNLETGDEYLLYLHDYNNYKNTTNIKKGYYTTHSAYVTNDFEFKYDVEYVSFAALGWTQEITVRVGDPNYDGDITDIKDKHDLPGAIDRDKTNELLEEDGLPTVDWDAVDKEFQIDTDGDGTPDIYDDDDDNDGIPDLDDNDRNGNGIKDSEDGDHYTDGTPAKPSDKPNIDNPINPNDPEHSTSEKDPEHSTGETNPDNPEDPEQTIGEDNENEQDNEEKSKGKKGYAIIFVIILIIACGAVLFLKWRNSLNGSEDEYE